MGYKPRGTTGISIRCHCLSQSMVVAFIVLSICALSDHSPLSQELEWDLETIDETIQFGLMSDRSVRIDQFGNPHIIHGTNRLRHSRHDGVQWRHYVIDASPGAGSQGSMVLDERGYPHVSYYDATEKDLKHARWNGVSWDTEIVASEGNVGQFTSIALDSSGCPHISFYDESRQELKMADYDGTSWSLQTVSSDEVLGPYTSLLFDDLSVAHIAYYDLVNKDLKYAYQDGSSWMVETADSAGNVGKYCSLALDTLGYPHISYLSGEPNNNVRHAFWDGNMWETEVIDQGYGGGYTSLSIDSDGSIHIAYMLVGRLRYAFSDGSAWFTETVPESWEESQVGYSASLALDASSCPHIAWFGEYWDGYNSQWHIRHSVRDSSGWQTMVVASQYSVGKYASLILDAAGFPCVAYHGSWLTYAKWDGHEWEIIPITIEADRNERISLTVDPADSPHVCYQYGNSLMYAYRVEDTWILDTVANYVANTFSLDMDSDGHPHISYGSSDKHWYAYHDGHSWEKTVVEEQASGGALRLDAQDRPHIAYRGANRHLKYAWSDGTAWIVQPVNTEDCDHIDLQLDTSDHPHLSFMSNGCLKYAFRDGPDWVSELVSQPEDPEYCSHGSNSSISLDASDRPRIAYQQYCQYPGYSYHYSVWFAHKNGVGWHTESIGGGSSCVLGVDASGLVHVVSHRKTGGFYSGKLEHRSTVGLPAELGGRKPEVLSLRIDGACPCMNPSVANLALRLAEESRVSLSAVDLLGRRVKTIHTGILSKGNHKFQWNGLDDRGVRVPSGTYICSAVVGGRRVSRRIVMIR